MTNEPQDLQTKEPPEYYWAAYEWRGSDRVKLHLIKHPKYNEPKWYVTTISADCFRNREAKRHYEVYLKNETLALRFHVMRFDEYEMDLNTWKSSLERNPVLSESYKEFKSLPTDRHENIFDFYKAVGWNYKKRKYITADVEIAPPVSIGRRNKI